MIVVPLTLFVLCLAAVNSELPPDGHGGGQGGGQGDGHGQQSCVCTSNEQYIRESFERTCKQDLLTTVKSTADHISADVKQVANTSYVLQQGIAYLKTAQETSTNLLKYQIRQGFDQVTQWTAETKQLIRSESANVISAQQSAINDLKQVNIFIFPFIRDIDRKLAI